jgi:hypothetical protein
MRRQFAVVPNFPIFGRGRYIMEALRPKIYQYFVESDIDGTPINRIFRSVVYQRAKRELDTIPFGTEFDVYLERLKNLELSPQDKWIIKSRYKNGTRMYHIADPDNSIFMVRPDRKRLIPMSYAAPIETEYWDDDGTAEYEEMSSRIEREGIVLERE